MIDIGKIFKRKEKGFYIIQKKASLSFSTWNRKQIKDKFIGSIVGKKNK